MGRKRKKGQKLGPRRKRMRRPARLESARTWLPTYNGRNVVRGYARWYGVDLLCAATELRSLGVKVSEDYEAQIRTSMEQRARAKERRSAAPPPEPPLDTCREDWRTDWYWLDTDAPEGWDDIPLADSDAVSELAPDLWDSEEEPPIEYAFLDDVFALDLKVIETQIEPLEEAPPEAEKVQVRIVLEEDPDVLAARAWSLIYVLGVFSYASARPRADSDVRFIEDDEWTIDDMLRRLAFDRGRLSFHAEHVRGRCMRTTIEITPDGKITLLTVDRGKAATRWIKKLLGKNMKSRVRDDGRWGTIPF